MRPEDVEAELEAVWERVHGAAERSAAPGAPAGGGPPSSASLETVRFLKAQYKEAEAYLQEMVELKEKELVDLRGRAVEAEARAGDLRTLVQERESELTAMMLRSQAWAEEQSVLFRSMRDSHQNEVEKLRAMEEELKARLDEETARTAKLIADFRSRETRLSKRIEELETLPKKLRAELDQGEAKVQTLSAALDRLKREKEDALRPLEDAVRAATERVLEERRAGEAADAARAKAEARAAELEEHNQQMKAAWAAERRQWQELWDRERSTWEAQREEMKAWETGLRREREAWLATLRAEEAKGLGLASRVAEVLAGLPGVKAIGVEPPWRSWARRAAAVLAAGGFVVAVFFGTRHALGKVWLRLETVVAVPVPEATAMALDGDRLWIASWDGHLHLFDPLTPAKAKAVLAPKGLGPYRPTSLSAAGGLWSLDAAQMRLIRHDPKDPERAEAFGDAGLPTALAHDGRELWVFEGLDRILFRYRARPGEGPQAGFPVAPPMVATAMQWSGGDLWMLDSSDGTLRRYRLEQGRLKLLNSDRIEGAVAFAVAEDRLWTLAREGDRTLLKRWRILHPRTGGARK